jgi:hypothetical protein
MSRRKQQASPEDVQRIVAHAREHLPCQDCGAPPGALCGHPGPGRSICKGRFVAAAIALRQQARAAQRTPGQQAELDAVLAGLPRVSAAEIEAGRSPRGGWTRNQLAEWGVPWPPPAGWLAALLRDEDGHDDR